MADAVFAAAPTVESARSQRATIRALAGDHGRDPDDIRVLPGLALYVAESEAQAHDLATTAASGSAARGAEHWTVIGTPEQAADEIAAWADADALDGLIALPCGSWESLRLFCTETVPLLAGAGLAPRSNPGSTLAEHLRLAR